MFVINNISMQHKEELLPYVRMLQRMSLKLYGSTGTADFYSTKGIPVSIIFLIIE